MKSYLFLLLLVFIASDVEEKTDEIILKDFAYDYFEELYYIYEQCDVFKDLDCINDKLAARMS